MIWVGRASPTWGGRRASLGVRRQPLLQTWPASSMRTKAVAHGQEARWVMQDKLSQLGIWPGEGITFRVVILFGGMRYWLQQGAFGAEESGICLAAWDPQCGHSGCSQTVTMLLCPATKDIATTNDFTIFVPLESQADVLSELRI